VVRAGGCTVGGAGGGGVCVFTTEMSVSLCPL